MKFYFLSIIFLLPCLLYGQESSFNQTDKEGKKQGYWIIKGIDKPDHGFCDTCIVEEGNYKDDRRQGEWKKYNTDGTLRLTVEFDNGRPKGEFKKVGGSSIIREESGNCFGSEK